MLFKKLRSKILRTNNINGTDKLFTNDNASAIKINSPDPSPKHQITSRKLKNDVGIATHIRLAHPKTNPQQTTNS